MCFLFLDENTSGKNFSRIQDLKSSTRADLHCDNDKWGRNSLRFNINLGQGWCLLLPISKVLITQYGARTGVEPLRFIIFIALLTAFQLYSTCWSLMKEEHRFWYRSYTRICVSGIIFSVSWLIILTESRELQERYLRRELYLYRKISITNEIVKALSYFIMINHYDYCKKN